HLPRDLPPQAVRRDDHRHAHGPRWLVAALAAHRERPVLARHPARRADLLLRPDVERHCTGRQPRRGVRARLFRRNIPVYRFERLATRTAIPPARPHQALSRIDAWPVGGDRHRLARTFGPRAPLARRATRSSNARSLARTPCLARTPSRFLRRARR